MLGAKHWMFKRKPLIWICEQVRVKDTCNIYSFCFTFLRFLFVGSSNFFWKCIFYDSLLFHRNIVPTSCIHSVTWLVVKVSFQMQDDSIFLRIRCGLVGLEYRKPLSPGLPTAFTSLSAIVELLFLNLTCLRLLCR